MDWAAARQVFASELLAADNRALQLKIGANNAAGTDLVIQRIDIQESLCNGIDAHITCLSTSSDLQLKRLIGQPVQVGIVTDTGSLRSISAIVTNARIGQSDGTLSVIQLRARDALAVMERRIGNRIFVEKSWLDIVKEIVSGWLSDSSALASCFELKCDAVNASNYPPRQFVQQLNESDAHFLRRLLKRAGISWYFRADPDKQDQRDTPAHQMVLIDRNWQLNAYPRDELIYSQSSSTQKRDCIDSIVLARELVADSVTLSSWDYLGVRVDETDAPNPVTQADSGLHRVLNDNRVEVAHFADNYDERGRITQSRAWHHAMQAKILLGQGSIRDIEVGQIARIVGHPEIEQHPQDQQRYAILSIHHRAMNNLPKELQLGQQLLGKDDTSTLSDEQRYRNELTAVRADTPIAPAWNPDIDLPAAPPVTALVTGPTGEDVYTDRLGRVKVQFQGANSGAEGAASAWVRYASMLAGDRFGMDFIPRIGMEVLINYLGGDPDKPIIVGVIHNGQKTPAAFSEVGQLPDNHYVSGIKTREIQGTGYGQLRYDDTPGQISVQLESSHASSQLNLGYLTQPRNGTTATPRGEGAEIRSDASVAIRSAKALLISAWRQLDARDRQLARDEYLTLMEDCLSLFKSLGQYASEHQGLPTDTDPHRQLTDGIRNWDSGSSTTNPPQNIGAATTGSSAIGITAPAGISMATPGTVVSYAGVNVDTVAAQHIQLSAGQRFNVHGAQGVGLFAHAGGMTAIANQGKVLLQAQNDDIEANAAKNIKWTASDGNIVGMAKEITLVAEDGSFLKIGKGVTLGTSGSINLQSDSFVHAGPATEKADLPTFTKAQLKQQLAVRYHDDTPVQGAPFKIHYDNGATFSGIVDEKGQADLTNAPKGPGRIELGEDARAYEVKATEKNPHYKADWDDSDMQATLDKMQGTYS
ncbi:type VI secretion system Vgr family protein [Paraburkholderia bannensis]|uniref:type VI secretion system Vgr family protein n=1 Tax=Paraburkholderia bannensis TaxID=765414 RepID=UPI002AB783EB|nr:type VI secretion system Vgr family protein [Paraburkholderia bannensis]